ncbi:MAG TPA: alpha/beta hydrolase [Candidatus Nanopelagicaceae bacterium]|jgi:pimeloyl-ACP methyl ester carboxylesterase|nr:alpha/beta hydrolase [Candidatus Nanopelagicaceae bacterium]
MKREKHVLSDGRSIEFMRNGVESDSAIILHAGTSQDITGWKVWLENFASNGVLSIAFGRSGYVGSTPKPGRITIDIAHDVAELADFLGVKRMVNVGLSGGGQHAIATGLDPRSVGVVTSGSLAPFEEMGEDFYLGMQQADIDEYADALRDIKDLVKRFQGGLATDPSAQFTPKEVSANDKRAQQSPSWKILFDSCDLTMKSGWDWVADDYSSYLRPWGFDPREIRVPVILWQGGLDKNVPPQHGQWLAKHIPNSKLKLIEDESHVGLYINYEQQAMKDAMDLLRA